MVGSVLGSEPRLSSLSVHVRGSAEALPVILRLLDAPGWYAIDIGLGEWLHLSKTPGEGFAAFRKFRDAALTAPAPVRTGPLTRLRRALRL